MLMSAVELYKWHVCIIGASRLGFRGMSFLTTLHSKANPSISCSSRRGRHSGRRCLMILARSLGVVALGLYVASVKLWYESSARERCEAVRLGFSRRSRWTARKYSGAKLAGADWTMVQSSGGRPEGILGAVFRSYGENLSPGVSGGAGDVELGFFLGLANLLL